MSCRLAAPYALALLAALHAGCTYFHGDSRVIVTSTPAGAEILLDGLATGRTTPAALELDGMSGDDHEIALVKPGYSQEVRRVYHYTSAYSARWIDGATTFELPSIPLWWTFGDFLLPFGVRWRYVPHELHVRLYPPGEQPVVAPPSATPAAAGAEGGPAATTPTTPTTTTPQ